MKKMYTATIRQTCIVTRKVVVGAHSGEEAEDRIAEGDFDEDEFLDDETVDWEYQEPLTIRT